MKLKNVNSIKALSTIIATVISISKIKIDTKRKSVVPRIKYFFLLSVITGDF